ncbi:hypothetical protein XAB3213_570005 [Xanthomonas citri pv. bilvae]|nr:hypothetical protein XAB3213_570005 [Xanthomonas citri pv. bilvae]
MDSPSPLGLNCKAKRKRFRAANKTTAQSPGGRGRARNRHVPRVHSGSERAVRTHLTAARYGLLATLKPLSSPGGAERHRLHATGVRALERPRCKCGQGRGTGVGVKVRRH